MSAAVPADATTNHCVVEQHGHILVITLNRPEARNALSSQMLATLVETWDRIDNDPEIRVAILTGAGGTFCAGADLKAMTKKSPGETFAETGNPMTKFPALLKGRRLTKPLIAAVEGYAVAGGTEILLGTDIRIAGESAKFGLAEPRWGLFPIGGSAVRLPRQIPYAAAADILLTGRQIPAPQALAWGLIGQVVPDGTALDEAMRVAELIAANGPIAVQAILRTMRETEALPEEDAFEIEAPIGIEVFKSQDSREGPLAFAEKRTPTFTGQ